MSWNPTLPLERHLIASIVIVIILHDFTLCLSIKKWMKKSRGQIRGTER